MQVKFREGRVATPELLQDVALPQSLEVLGQRVDLSPVQVSLSVAGFLEEFVVL